MNKNVVHIVLNHFTNDSRVIRECKSLVNKGYSVTVIALWAEGLKLEESNNGYSVIRIALTSRPWSKNPILQMIKYLEFLIRSLFIIKKIKPNICHGHDPDALLIGYIYKLLWKSKLIYDSHELWAYSMHMSLKNGILFKIGGVIEKRLIVRADAVITVSDSIAKIIKVDNQLNKVIVIRNIPENIHLTSIPSREQLKFPNVRNILIYVGKIANGRGLGIIINILKNIDNNIGLVVLGVDSHYKNDLIQLVNDYDLNTRVKFINAVKSDEVIAMCSLADAGIAPIENICKSYYYSLPNKVFEYIQAGIPVLCSDFPEMKSIINQYSVGEVFNINDPVSIQQTINNYFKSPDKISIYKSNCLKTSKIINWKNEEKKLFNLYKRL